MSANRTPFIKTLANKARMQSCVLKKQNERCGSASQRGKNATLAGIYESICTSAECYDGSINGYTDLVTFGALNLLKTWHVAAKWLAKEYALYFGDHINAARLKRDCDGMFYIYIYTLRNVRALLFIF